MSKITFIQGLVASGKSHLASILESKGAFKIDDKGLNPTGQWCSDFNRNYPIVKSMLEGGTDCVVVEVFYNQQANRDFIERKIASEVPGTEIEWIFYENNIEAALWNCFADYYKGKRKDLAGNIYQNLNMTRFYEIPADAVPLSIFKISIP